MFPTLFALTAGASEAVYYDYDIAEEINCANAPVWTLLSLIVGVVLGFSLYTLRHNRKKSILVALLFAAALAVLALITYDQTNNGVYAQEGADINTGLRYVPDYPNYYSCPSIVDNLADRWSSLLITTLAIAVVVFVVSAGISFVAKKVRKPKVSGEITAGYPPEHHNSEPDVSVAEEQDKTSITTDSD